MNRIMELDNMITDIIINWEFPIENNLAKYSDLDRQFIKYTLSEFNWEDDESVPAYQLIKIIEILKVFDSFNICELLTVCRLENLTLKDVRNLICNFITK